MIRGQTTAAYRARFQRVLDAIHERLDASLDLEALAEIACLSPHHFHRIYRVLIGETVADTVRRLRLQRASNALTHTDSSIGVIARQAGYGTVAAFSRAFRSAYDQTPTSFRAGETSKMTVVIQDRTPMRLAVVSHTGAPHLIGRAFDTLVAWAGPRGLLAPPAVGVAIYLDDMSTTPPEAQRAFAGITVAQDFETDGAVTDYVVPGGRHAVVLYKGPYAKIGQAYDEVYTWLAASNEEPADAPAFEVNLNNPRNTASSDLLTEVCVPLK